MKTPLRRVLLLSGVKIESDPDYMRELEEVQSEVAAWHKKAKGTDNYFSWKVRWCVRQHGADAMIEAVKHIHKGNDDFLMYPLDTIVKAIEEEGKRGKTCSFEPGPIPKPEIRTELSAG